MQDLPCLCFVQFFKIIFRIYRLLTCMMRMGPETLLPCHFWLNKSSVNNLRGIFVVVIAQPEHHTLYGRANLNKELPYNRIKE